MSTLLDYKPKFKTFQLPLMECTLYDPNKPHRFPLTVQPKLNGLNARYYCGQLVSKHGKIWSSEVVKPYLEELIQYESKYKELNNYQGELMIQGEFWSPSLSLQEIVSLVSVIRTSPPSDWKDLRLWIFDVVELGNLNVSYLNRSYKFLDTQKLNFQRLTHCPEKYCPHGLALNDFEVVWKQKHNHEGFIYRYGSCYYQNGRSPDLKKSKVWNDSEVKVVAWKKGELGKFQNTVGALICETREGNRVAVSGFTDEERNNFLRMAKEGILVGLGITIKYTSLSENGIPLNPQFVCVRNYE